MNNFEKFILDHADADPQTLLLSANRFPEIDVKLAAKQIQARQKIKQKLPSWHANLQVLYPPTLSLEQCSSEKTAQYKAALLSGETLVDFTGGFGVDSAAFAKKFTAVSYVEQNKELCNLARHNFAALGLNNITVYNTDAEHFANELSPKSTAFLDPARRSSSGEKVFLLDDCTPNLKSLLPILRQKFQTILLKLSPMLDLKSALKLLPDTKSAHILAINGECKELLLLIEPNFIGEPDILSVNLKSSGDESFSFTFTEEKIADVTLASTPEKFLYEPNAAVLKAGAFRAVAVRFGVKKLHANTHLYTSETPIENFPGRRFQIEKVCRFSKSELKAALGGGSQANVAVRNFPATADELKKRLKLRDGGEIYIFACTIFGEEKSLLICRKF